MKEIIKNIKKYPLVIFFGVLLYVLSIADLFSPVYKTSELENRDLATFPKFSMKLLFNNEYTPKIEDFTEDHFIKRDAWISLKSISESVLGKKENNGVVYGEDGYMFTKFVTTNYSQLEKNVIAVKEFIERHSDRNVKLLLAPTAPGVMTDKVLESSPVIDTEYILGYVNSKIDSEYLVDVKAELSQHTDEYIYYRTDHHWTTEGAYYGYCEYMKALGRQPQNLDSFVFNDVENFLGTHYSKAKSYNVQADVLSYIESDAQIDIGGQVNSIYEKESLDLFNSICGGGSAEQNYNLECALKDKYFGYVKENIKSSNKISLLYNINNNFISLILKTTIFISTIFLISQIKATELTLSVYLILTPYLTSSAENLISFFDIFSEIGLIDNIINNFESLKYRSETKQEKPIPINTYNLYFYNASINNKLSLKDINLKINYKDAICFVGDEDYKIEEIFNILSKKQNVSSGCVFLDDKNISDIDIPSFNKVVSFVTPNEQFFNISIFENLYLVCPSKSKILKEIKNLELVDLINSFQNKINTIIDNSISAKSRFFLGLARAYLSGSKIINIYKFPDGLDKTDRDLFKSILKTINKSCTVICYFNQEWQTDLFDEIYIIEKNKLKMNKMSKIANNNNRN